MKKFIILLIVLFAYIGSNAQQMMIVLDSIKGGAQIPYCERVDQITFVAPDGATDVSWVTNYSFKKEGNDLIIYNVHPIAKYGDEVLCVYTKGNVKGEKKYITLHMISSPTIPTFKDCALENGMITLDASPITLDVWGFTTYSWSNGSKEKMIAVTFPGTYTVMISNLCGSITYSVTIYADKNKQEKKPPSPPVTTKKLRNPDDVKKSGLKHWWMVWKYEHL